jgi:release factor glutamine methyltransferase
MTVQDALYEGTSILYFAEVETPFLDASLLLSHALGVSKEKLFASLPDRVEPSFFKQFKMYLDERCHGVPVSYIRHKKEFYGLEFFVDERVLVPRPDTETLVDTVRGIVSSDNKVKRLHDLCTGSGCIAITLQYLFPEMEISASDVSEEVYEVFRYNCRQLVKKELAFFYADLFAGLPEKYDLIASNPPYLTDGEVDNLKKIDWSEPEIALRGGRDGLDFLKEIIRLAPCFLRARGYLFLEAAPGQMKILKDFMEKLDYINITVVKDLAKRERVIYARIK